MRALLRSPFHSIASANLCLLSYRGRRSGRQVTTPLSFTRDGRLVRLLTSHNTRWWKNFVAAPSPVEIEIARTSHRGLARAITQDNAPFRNGIRAFLTALPRDARVYGIKLDRDRRPREEDIASAAGHVVLVEVELQG
jgi:hypothetical protein